ncbi:transporter [Ganoderma sinense ZZ0214-1]|uniref:non-specific serine/threonine protein kinase n=1 Tax=Ganoderma sinense ZZ0214-1 TaxID=1077348 RepID=A0A2G8S038_9APHY|nr:transporter [Ganoderma sinense ZZ0214-1]
MQQTMKRFSLSLKPLFGLFCKPKSPTDDIDIDSVPKITIIPPIEDMYENTTEGSPGNPHFPLVDAIVVAQRSTAPVELQAQTQTIDETRLTVPTFKSPRRVQSEEPKPESKPKPLSPEQRRKFIASLPPPPPPPVKFITSPPLPPSHPSVESTSTGELSSELLPWTGLFQDDLPDDDSDEGSSSSSSSGSEPERLSMDQFLVLCLLGKGAQGDVYLVKHRAKMVFYALKAVPKSATKNGYYGNLFAEQFALKVVAGDPRFVNLQGTFQDDKYFYILTDLYAYGDLRSEMREVGRYEEDEARQYAAQIAISIEALHKRRILHRDIKPDNLFLNSRHDVVLGDFGLCRTFGRSTAEQPWREAGVRAWTLPEDRPGSDYTLRTKDEAKKICGTPRYIAPEVYGLDSDGWYSYEADIFSFGVILYELLHGKLPFGMKNDDEPEHLIVRTLRAELEVDGDVSEEAADLLYMILDKDPSKRPNWDRIKAHEWFRFIDWDDVLIKSQPPTPIVFDHFEPTSHARSVTFGEPYTDDESPFPFFDWTSPEISFQPSVSTTSMYKVSPDWEPTTDILQVMGWPVACSQNNFMTCPSVRPSPIRNTSTVVPPLSTRKSHSAIVVQGPFDGTIPSSKTSSMSSTCAVALNHTAASKLDLHGLGVHPELDAPADAMPCLFASCSVGLLDMLDVPSAPSEVLSFNSSDIAKALEIMNIAIQDIPVDDHTAQSFNASVEATMCSPLGSLPPAVSSDFKHDTQSLSSRVHNSTSMWSTSACHDHTSATLLDAPVDVDATTTVSLAGCMDPPTEDCTRSTSDMSSPSRRCVRGSSSSDGSLTSSTSSARPRLRRLSARRTSGSGSEASTSTAVTGSSDTFASPTSSRGSWGKLSGKVKGWWSTLSGGKGVRLRGKRRASDASSASG